MTRHTVPIRSRFDMHIMWRAAVLMMGLAGCQFGGGGAAPTDVAAPSAITGPAVEVTALAPLGSVEPASGAPSAAAPVDVPSEAPVAAAPPTPVIVKSPSQVACEKTGGNFVVIGRSGAMTCQKPTRDGGKQCKRESDCDGVCLARSNTCAPVKPLFGCQSILQDDGRRVELCID
ncbi:hypothetical protein [Pseudorhodobacter ferrugineus]|uniref:hypothetical protein n=2 Tax=Pseudorhodobacter ferrugineus TaxID=77008 RepID=UPI0012DCF0C1|nr:hypothetical protein [Pseudorhodobacter ferrugineus]